MEQEYQLVAKCFSKLPLISHVMSINIVRRSIGASFLGDISIPWLKKLERLWRDSHRYCVLVLSRIRIRTLFFSGISEMRPLKKLEHLWRA